MLNQLKGIILTHGSKVNLSQVQLARDSWTLCFLKLVGRFKMSIIKRVRINWFRKTRLTIYSGKENRSNRNWKLRYLNKSKEYRFKNLRLYILQKLKSLSKQNKGKKALKLSQFINKNFRTISWINRNSKR